MAVPRTADFVAAGRTDAWASRARGSLVATRYPRDSKSWQAKAYWSGFDEEVERLSKSAVLNQEGTTTGRLPSTRSATSNAPRGIDPARMPANTKGWPKSAAEHARVLVEDLNRERDPARRKRLTKALCRMQARHGKAAAA